MGLAIGIKDYTKIKIGNDIVLEFSNTRNKDRKVVITAPTELKIHRISETEKLNIEGTKPWKS